MRTDSAGGVALSVALLWIAKLLLLSDSVLRMNPETLIYKRDTPKCSCNRIMKDTDYATIPVTPETRDRVRSLKRGGQDYESLIRAMCQQYDPDEATR